MADTKASAFPVATTLAVTDIIPCIAGGGTVTSKITFANLRTALAIPAAAGSANVLQTSDGAGGLTAATDVLAGAGYISVGTDPASAGALRLAAGGFIRFKNSANADVALIGSTGDACYIGTDTTYANQATNVSIYAAGNIGLGIGGSTYLYVIGGQLEAWKPIVGGVSASSPYGVHGGASYAFATDANYSVAAAQFSYDTVDFQTGAITADRMVTFPHPATKALGYRKTVFNNTTHTLTVSTGTGSTWALLPGMRGRLWFDDGGVRLDETSLNVVSTANATPVYRDLATFAVGEVKQFDVIAKVANASGSVRQVFKLSALYYGAAGPVATIDGTVTSTATGTGGAAVTIDTDGAGVVRLKITGVAEALTTTYDVSVI